VNPTPMMRIAGSLPHLLPAPRPSNMMQRLAVLMLAWLVLVPGGNAQDYPNRPIRLVVPVPPGGAVDTFARALTRQLEGRLGPAIVVDNRGGANGIIGADLVAKATPDGYTLMSIAFAFAINPAMYKHLPYDTEKDFVPITNYVNGLGYLFVAHPCLPAQSAKDVIALAREKQLSYSSPGIGNGAHLGGEDRSAVSGKRSDIEE